MTANILDVLIVGAGLSGIGAACHLRQRCPTKTLAIVESRTAMGGTWDLFRYPGIRSDSDMFTLGYSFAPWHGKQAIAKGEDILSYIQKTAKDHDVEGLIHYGQQVVQAEWSSTTALWTVTTRANADAAPTTWRAAFLYLCTGYYRYDQGYTPDLPGMERFQGQLIHPQHWPSKLNYRDKRVVIIGSGATAMTLAPAMSVKAAHVTMLQRSPTYVVSRPWTDGLASRLKQWLPAKVSSRLVRQKNILMSSFFYTLSRRKPALVKRMLRDALLEHLPEELVNKHFTPSYNPWDQRICLVPDGDLFTAINEGKLAVVTDQIETFEADGIRLSSGDRLEADIVVTATGLNLLPMGGMNLLRDGKPIDISQTVGYKGNMLTGVPNLAFTTGYTNASWTLKADLVADYVCRVLRYMDRHGYRVCIPAAPDADVQRRPLIDLQANYVKRSVDAFPKQGDRLPWQLHQNYLRDTALLRLRAVADRKLQFFGPPQTLPELKHPQHSRPGLDPKQLNGSARAEPGL